MPHPTGRPADFATIEPITYSTLPTFLIAAPGEKVAYFFNYFFVLLFTIHMLGASPMEKHPVTIEPMHGKLGILLVGLGAVSTTFIAGVESVRRGVGKPFGSLTQTGRIRLGKRTEHKNPLINEFVPIAPLDQLVFLSWDPIPDNAYEAAKKAGVLNTTDQEPL